MAFLCYALLVCAWIVDLFTPQLFIAAILLNGPIALSSLALNRRLTTSLMITAEIANAIACYVNGVQNHGHWDGIAVGDRVLSALSFLLVGSLAIRTQEHAREAGESSSRARQVDRERALREAVERLRSSLNVELVLRELVRESTTLISASRSILVLRAGFETPRIISYAAGRDVTYESKPLHAELATLVERARAQTLVSLDADDAFGRSVLAAFNARHVLAVALRVEEADKPVLVLLSDDRRFGLDATQQLRRFAEQAAVALAQAQLFERLGRQNDEIVRQRDEIGRRGEIIRDIVYALAHDLRTPLVAADVTMRQALRGAYGDLPERYRDVLKTTMISNDDERRLLETLLLLARYESDEASEIRERVDCGALTQRVAAEMKPVAHAKGVALETQTPLRPLYVTGDESELRRALTNLTANAVAATPSGGRVCIESASRNGHVTLCVSDDGYGVPAEQRAGLFKRFVARGPGGGSGLGLYIVRRIAEKHGGGVDYAPRDPRGSTFTVTLASGGPP